MVADAEAGRGGLRVVCGKLDPNLFTCVDHPGVRCIHVELAYCRPKLVEVKNKVSK
jgi:hypothetical protein